MRHLRFVETIHDIYFFVGLVHKNVLFIHSFVVFVSSALYVVDLAKLRQLAAGDALRVYYENLSKDPNSLSNLDQVNHLPSL